MYAADAAVNLRRVDGRTDNRLGGRDEGRLFQGIAWGDPCGADEGVAPAEAPAQVSLDAKRCSSDGPLRLWLACRRQRRRGSSPLATVAARRPSPVSSARVRVERSRGQQFLSGVSAAKCNSAVGRHVFRRHKMGEIDSSPALRTARLCLAQVSRRADASCQVFRAGQAAMGCGSPYVRVSQSTTWLIPGSRSCVKRRLQAG